MKRYIVIREQSGGCDYTIRCGLDYDIYSVADGETLEEVIKKELLRDHSTATYAHDHLEELGVEYIAAYEIKNDVGFDHQLLMSELRLEKDKEQRAKEIEADQAEFERLKKKLRK